MKTIKTALQHIFCASMLALLVTSVPGAAAPAGVPAPQFRRFLPHLIGHTTIPILLPSWLPAESTGRWCGGDVYQDGYSVWLPSKAEFLDNAPHNAESVDAQRISPKTPAEEGVPVALSGGRVGYFQASEWNARPTEAWLDWSEHGVRYTVGEYIGTKEDLVHMANSVVAVGGVGEIPPALRPALPQLRRSGFSRILLPTYLPPFGKPLAGWQNLTPVMDTEALEDGYLISFSSPRDKYDDTLATLEADEVVPQLGSLMGDPVNLWIRPPISGTKKLLFRGRYVATDPKDPSFSALIRWDAAGFRYQMTWRGASVAQMVQMAESCVPVTFPEGSSRTGVKANGSRQ